MRRLLQERFRDEPWKLLVACILLNRTKRRQVDRIIDALFFQWPSPRAMARADEAELAEVLKPLGLYNRRAATLKKMSTEYVEGVDVPALSGVGKYAYDSYRLFVDEDWTIEPEDKELKAYMRERRRR